MPQIGTAQPVPLTHLVHAVECLPGSYENRVWTSIQGGIWRESRGSALAPSASRAVMEKRRQLSDLRVLRDGADTYLPYSVTGEQGIAVLNCFKTRSR